MSLDRNHQVSRLVLKADAPLAFQVELKDPSTVVLHLPGSRIGASLPKTDADPLVASLAQEPDGAGVALVVRTRAPGVTVLPLYEARSRRLTLELGGNPVLQEQVPAEPKTGKAAAEGGKPPASDAAPGPESRAPAPPKPQGPPPVVTGVRVGSHQQFSRLVLDGDAAMSARVEPDGAKLVLRLARGRLRPNAHIDRGDGRITGLKVLSTGPLALELSLARPLAGQKLFTLNQATQVVLDVRLLPPGAKPKTPPPAARPEAQHEVGSNKPAPGPAGVSQPPSAPAQAKADQAGQEQPPATRPAEAAAAAPKAAAQVRPAPEPRHQPRQVAAAYTDRRRPQQASGALPPPGPAPAAQASPGEAGGERLPAPTARAAAELPFAVPAAVHRRNRALATGGMPPVAPPPALARPRTAPYLSTPATPPPSTEAVIARIKKYRQQPGRPGAAPGRAGPPVRPPQGALLGKAARLDQKVRALFERAKLALDQRQYAQALSGFERLLKQYPKHPLAGEATFRAADAYFYLHQRDLWRFYEEVQYRYQQAIDLYPDSDQVPWGFLMLGKAAALAGEPYKAIGYFQLVIEDYPKSEYVPLAMVNRGRAWLAEEKWNLALEEFRDVARKFPQSRFRKDADWGQAQALFGMARYQRASLLLKDMDRRYPELRLTEPELLYYIGEAEFQLKRYSAARRYFLWALNIMPGMADADIILTRVGDTYQFEKSYAAAKDVYRQVIKLFPETDGALVAQIRLAESPQKDEQHAWDIFQVKATTDALKVYREIREKYPDRQVAQLAQLKLAVYYYKTKKYPQALGTLEKLIRTHPRTPFAAEARYTMNLAAMGLLSQLRAENKPLALMDAYLRNRALITRPNSNQVLTLLAWAYERTGLNGRAAKLYQVLVERALGDPVYSLDLARNLMVERRYDGVVDALDKDVLAGLKPEQRVEAQSLLGRALSAMGLHKKAVSVLQPLLAEHPKPPGSARAYLALGHSLAKKGQISPALKALDQADAMFDPGQKLERYLAAMEAGFAAAAGGMPARSTGYFKKAVGLASDAATRAQAMYELARGLGAAGKPGPAVDTYKKLAALKVAPWSGMAERHLADIQLAPRLAQVGK